ncbi:rod shape-determining protein [Candidatus Epulonipiscium fishelsonii]|uniref:Rod shape-determining protein n=1 Tax=Candidatus Epulonipiscium fishelsonii TaxID=77094 RepID=A0ACC8XD92_9FIRM|nr:rod shape-determining protein [Epulopiscium sp. SCG-B05WGA-EpuloA1]ONI40772.1 rod shape-determining protein [Epulopiscium sp. SCG-B11WGA-EpuloA1]
MFPMGTDIGIDLGTSSVLVYSKGQGIVLKEASIVAVKENTNEIFSIGEDAKKMWGKTPFNIKTIKPLRNGVISNYEATEQMLRYCIKKSVGRKLVRPRIAVCIPSVVTEVERKAVEDATKQAGARIVEIIEEPIAAAIGAGIDISKPAGNMVVDIGGGTTDIAVISLGGSVVKYSLKIAGDAFDDAIIKYVRNKYNIIIGDITAEKVKITVGSVFKIDDMPQEVEIKGIYLVNGLPKKIFLTNHEIRDILQDQASAIIEAILNVLEVTPPELSADILNKGILLTGGGSLMRGLSELISTNTGINATIAKDASNCVAIGTGLFIEYKQKKNFWGKKI